MTGGAAGAPDTVDAYIASFPAEVQPILETIRATIRAAVPDAEETISYRIPTFKRNGTYLIYFAGFKKHVSIYPILSECPGFEDDVAPYRSGSGTAKFPLNRPIPFALIDKIARSLADDNARRASGKAEGKQS